MWSNFKNQKYIMTVASLHILCGTAVEITASYERMAKNIMDHKQKIK